MTRIRFVKRRIEKCYEPGCNEEVVTARGNRNQTYCEFHRIEHDREQHRIQYHRRKEDGYKPKYSTKRDIGCNRCPHRSTCEEIKMIGGLYPCQPQDQDPVFNVREYGDYSGEWIK